MRLGSRVPLAWLNLTHSTRRLVVSVAGITSAVVLMFMELGFWNAMMDGQAQMLLRLNGDLVMLNAVKRTVTQNLPFPRRRLYQAAGVDGVQAAYPLYVEALASLWRNRDTGGLRSIRVLAFRPEDPVFLDADIDRQRATLATPDAALIDVKSKRFYGALATGVVTELAWRRIHVVGTFALGTDFAYDGNVILSDRNFLRYFPQRRAADDDLGPVDLGVLRVTAGADAVAVRDALRAVLPGDVVVLTKPEMVDLELKYWQKRTPIGFIFALLTGMGFAIGGVICYQILFTDVVRHLPQFATVKALGYPNRYLVGLVLREALLLSVMGFVPGVIISWVMYGSVAAVTGLPLDLTAWRGTVVLILTVAMCTISGIAAMRKALSADPAELFG